MSTIGVPTKLLQESLGHVITVELKTGQVYRGKLFEGQSVMERGSGRHAQEEQRGLSEQCY